ncbi:hypothetical protein KQI52_13160 [bacterium]|nr:hypothetical protein [bacterium]
MIGSAWENMKGKSREALPETFGDPLPISPDIVFSPEARHAAHGFKRTVRRLWIAATHPRGPAPLLPANDHVDRIIVIHPGPLRELVFAEPALRALRLRFTRAKRVLYAPKDAPDLFAGTGWGEIKPLADLAKATPGRDESCIVLDFTHEAEYERAKLLRAAKFSHRLGVNVGGRGPFYNIPAVPAMLNDHLADYYLQLAELIGTEVVGRTPSLPHGFDRLERGRNLWREQEIDHPVILLPGWDGHSFGWPADVFTDLAHTMGEMDFVVVAGPEDSLRAKPVADALDCPFYEKVPLSRLMDMLATAALVVGNDSGHLHLAAALDSPVVLLTVNPHPWRSWPRAQKGAAVFRGQVGDSAKVRFDRVPVSDIAAMALRLKERDE